MDRQTLDMEGARRGELSAASLQLGDDTIAIQAVATMSVETQKFFPWDTEANQQAQKINASLFVGGMFIAIMALAAWGMFVDSQIGLICLVIGAPLALISMYWGYRAVRIATRMKHEQPYFRLTIGTSDGRQIPLVDDNKDVLIRIRDTIRVKMDTGDRSIVGDFDLNLDRVDFDSAKTDAEPLRAVSPPGPSQAAEELFESDRDYQPAKT